MDKIVHFELPADDVSRASKFYSDVFGWGMQNTPEHTLITTVEVDEKTQMPKEAGGINGGMFKRTPDLPVTVVTIDVKDIDAALEKVKAAGGSVVREKARRYPYQ